MKNEILSNTAIQGDFDETKVEEDFFVLTYQNLGSSVQTVERHQLMELPTG